MSTNAIRQADGSVINVRDLTPGGYYIVDGDGLPTRVGSPPGRTESLHSLTNACTPHPTSTQCPRCP
jgi:hypothetical protein